MMNPYNMVWVDTLYNDIVKYLQYSVVIDYRRHSLVISEFRIQILRWVQVLNYVNYDDT